MLQICFSVFCGISTVTRGYGSVNKSVSLYTLGELQNIERIKIIDNMTGNCTDTKADITVTVILMEPKRTVGFGAGDTGKKHNTDGTVDTVKKYL